MSNKILTVKNKYNNEIEQNCFSYEITVSLEHKITEGQEVNICFVGPNGLTISYEDSNGYTKVLFNNNNYFVPQNIKSRKKELINKITSISMSVKGGKYDVIITSFIREYDEKGYDQEGYNKEGYDKEGFNRGGYDKEGFNREGYDKGGLIEEDMTKKVLTEKDMTKKVLTEEDMTKKDMIDMVIIKMVLIVKGTIGRV